MRRYPHYMARAAGGRYPYRIIAVDVVSHLVRLCDYPVRERECLLSWSAYVLAGARAEYRPVATAAGDTTDSWWEWLASECQRKGQTWAVSYRCGRVWPLLGFWEELESGRYTLCASAGPRYDSRGAAVRALSGDSDRARRSVSSAAVSRMLAAPRGLLVAETPPCLASLRSTAGRFGLLWLDLQNYGIDPPDTVPAGEERAEWIAHAMCSIGRACIDYYLGSLKATAGAQAIHAYQHHYLPKGVYCHNDTRGIAGEANAYHGGRAEAFLLAASRPHVWHLDLRSSYASQCVATRVPIRLQGHCDNPGREVCAAHCAAGTALAHITLETDEPAYPYRRTASLDAGRSSSSIPRDLASLLSDTGIIYPVGIFDTWLCGPELRDAWERGRVRQVHWLQWYHCDYALRDYALSLYALRCQAEAESDVALKQFAKRMLVSLPGKLAQRDRSWDTGPWPDPGIPWGVWWGADERGLPVRYRALAGVVQRETVGGWSYDAVPAMAGWITSAARVRLLECIRAAGWEHTLYCDTDSIMVDEDGYHNLWHAGLIRDHELGYLYVSAANATVTIRGIKYYIQDGKTVCAGLPKGTERVLPGGQGIIRSRTPGEAARLRSTPDATRTAHPWTKPGAYTHRHVLPDGSTRPIRLGESNADTGEV